ncbi:hypothetical protein L0222_25640 [bacterium]|nr:hypothetical protein [bacterium]MCI0604265.1 hypothetical protein [bacterium]
MRLSAAFLVLLLLSQFAWGDKDLWTSYGPYGGYFHSFAFSPANEQLIFASEFDGLFRSVDQGLTWQRVQIPGGEFNVRMHPKSPEIIIAANYANGIFESLDDGVTWTQVFQYPFEEDSFYDFEFHPSNSAVLYAISYYHGVFKSTDSGRSWIAKNSGLSLTTQARCCVDTPQLEVDPNHPETVYVLMPSRQVYKTTDGGESWRLASTGLKLTDPAHALVIDPKDTRTLYAGGVNGIFRTTDGGFQWKSRGCKCSARSLALDPKNPDILYAAGEGALRSADKGATWEWFSPHPYIASIFLSVAVHPAHPELVFVGGFGAGVARSKDRGNSWETRNDQLDALNVVRLIVHPKVPNRLLAVAGQQVYLSLNGGHAWDLPLRSRSSAFYFSDVAVHPVNPDLIVAAGARKDKPGAIVFSKDGGKNWEAGKHFSGVNYGCARCVAFDPGDQKTLYVAPFNKTGNRTTQLGVARSKDLGKSWKLLNNGLTAKDVWVITVHPKESSKIYAGTGSGKLFVSGNAGETWIDRSAGLDQSSIRAIVPDPSDSSTMYVATYTSVFKSIDAGQTWVRKTNGLPDSWYNFVDVDARNHQHVYAAGEAGIFHSSDGGESWSVFDSRSPGPFAVWNLLINPAHPDTYYAGTDRGVFSLVVSSIQ